MAKRVMRAVVRWRRSESPDDPIEPEPEEEKLDTGGREPADVDGVDPTGEESSSPPEVPVLMGGVERGVCGNTICRFELPLREREEEEEEEDAEGDASAGDHIFENYVSC